ncbi:MAG: 50S ribosomal protein L25/general stress protein Ctc [Wenzhouxiangellaceae bacterium]|nr:50S ribosomal protein L25/general stress protein Ctc [Wenzhouxiangellaceae bacterium]
MTKTYEVPAEVRKDVGKGASRRLRRENKVPAVIYGGTRKPANLTLEHDFILHAVDQESFHSSILDVKVGDGRSQKVILRDLQRHPFKPRVMHVDFQRVRENEEIRLDVPLHFTNEEISPAHKQAGVIISYLLTELEISALPKNLPEYIEIDLAKFEPGQRVMMSEVVLPEGVTIPALEHGDDYDEAIVAAIYIRQGQGTGELAAEADAALAEGVEPELAEEELVEEEAEKAAKEGSEDVDARGEAGGEEK